MDPTRSYLLCATAGSGSRHVCRALADTGIAGRPEEHFEAHRYPGLPRDPSAEFLGVADRTVSRHLELAFEAGTTPNGCFGAKVLWGYFGDLVGALGTIPANWDTPAEDLLPRVFPRLKFVRVVREDKAGQAISLARRLQGQGFSLRRPSVADLHRRILTEEAGWDSYLEQTGIETIRVAHEDFEADPEGTTQELLEQLDLTPARLPSFRPVEERQTVAA